MTAGTGLRWRTISLSADDATAYLPITLTAGTAYTEELRVLGGAPETAPLSADFLVAGVRARWSVGEVRGDLFRIELPGEVTAQLYLAAGPAGGAPGSSAVGVFRISLGGIVVADGPMTLYPGDQMQWADAADLEQRAVVNVRGFVRGEWTEGQQMQVGDIVVHGGRSYFALADGVLAAPDPSPGGNALGSNFVPGTAPAEAAEPTE